MQAVTRVRTTSTRHLATCFDSLAVSWPVPPSVRPSPSIVPDRHDNFSTIIYAPLPPLPLPKTSAPVLLSLVKERITNPSITLSVPQVGRKQSVERADTVFPEFGPVTYGGYDAKSWSRGYAQKRVSVGARVRNTWDHRSVRSGWQACSGSGGKSKNYRLLRAGSGDQIVDRLGRQVVSLSRESLVKSIWRRPSIEVIDKVIGLVSYLGVAARAIRGKTGDVETK